MIINVLCADASHLEAALQRLEAGDIITLECDGFRPEEYAALASRIREAGLVPALALPYIFRTAARNFLERNSDLIAAAGFEEILVRNVGELAWAGTALKTDARLVTDYNVYAMNHVSEEILKELGSDRITAPVELNERELRQLGLSGKEMIIYGHLPMMFSAQCLRKNLKGCDHTPSVMYLKDRTGKRMPVQNHCSWCCNIILNALPLSLCTDAGRVSTLGPSVGRISLTVEDGRTASEVIGACIGAFRYGRTGAEPVAEYTRGHLNRGVE